MSVNTETSSTLKELSDKNPDGTRLGQDSTDLVAFYGGTPVVQPTSADQAEVTTAAIASVTTAAITSVTTTGSVAVSGVYGYTTAAQADGIVTAINAILVRQALIETAVNSVITRAGLMNTLGNALRSALVSLGLIKGS